MDGFRASQRRLPFPKRTAGIETLSHLGWTPRDLRAKDE